MTSNERTKRLAALGYTLRRNYWCPIRQRRMPYARLPNGPGSVCVFDTLAEVDRHIAQVEQIRSWQQD